MKFSGRSLIIVTLYLEFCSSFIVFLMEPPYLRRIVARQAVTRVNLPISQFSDCNKEQFPLRITSLVIN